MWEIEKKINRQRTHLLCTVYSLLLACLATIFPNTWGDKANRNLDAYLCVSAVCVCGLNTFAKNRFGFSH